MQSKAILLFCLVALSVCQDSCMGYSSQIANIAAQYASCSSVTTHYLHEIISWNYTYCVNAQPQKKFIKDVAFVIYNSKNLFGLLLYDQEKDLIVLSFRATVCGSGNANGKTDLNLDYKLYNQWGCKFGLCRSHAGFLNSYNLMKTQIRQKVKLLIQKYSTAKIMITGVSLGGALAALASYDIKMYLKSQNLNPQFYFYTFGQPRIGNYFFIKQFNKQVLLFRVVDSADPVPHLPPRKLLQSQVIYYSPGIEVYYGDGDVSNFNMCAGDNDKCSLNRKGLYEVCNHLYYPLMNFSGNSCSVKNAQYSFGITEEQTLKQNQKIVQFFLHECKLTCESMDPMFCPYYRIPELHCQPLQMKQSLLWDLIQLISTEEQINKIRPSNKLNLFQTVCSACEFLTKKHKIIKIEASAI